MFVRSCSVMSRQRALWDVPSSFVGGKWQLMSLRIGPECQLWHSKH